MNRRHATAQAINMLHQKYIVKQMNVCRGYKIMAVGESKSAMGSAEFHWHKFQWGKSLVNTVID